MEFLSGEWYKELPDYTGYLLCTYCKTYPKVWAFDNGLQCKCCCQGMYDKPAAIGECINAYVKKSNGSFVGYKGREELMNNWNAWVNNNDNKTI
jgi:hypothetical protein